MLSSHENKARELRGSLITAYEQAQTEANKAELTLAKAESELQSARSAFENAKKLSVKEEFAFEQRLKDAGFLDWADYQQAEKHRKKYGPWRRLSKSLKKT